MPHPVTYLVCRFFPQRELSVVVAVFMADLLQYYKIHISQLSPLGMVRARPFEYFFWSQKIEPTIEHFLRFYQLQAQLGFYSFLARWGAKRILVVPPKSFNEWKSKFFYIKAARIACKLEVSKIFQGSHWSFLNLRSGMLFFKRSPWLL
ncbi:hypothetical protein Hdeb2414_s0008g00289761 [Helianthus debilis subsp. tardiflorus]